MRPSFCDKFGSLLVVLVSFGIAGVLVFATRQLNFVGSDEERLYLPAAHELPFINYLSGLSHSFNFDNPQLIHGKEISILNFYWMQGLLKDYSSLRPFLWMVILALAISSVLVFFIACHYWGAGIGFLCFGMFISSFWPYLYVLLVKHQPIGLMYFLSAVFVLRWPQKPWINVLSGILMGLSCFASPVSGLYVPLYAAAVYCSHKNQWSTFQPFALAATGLLAVVYFVSYPDILGNLQGFMDYVHKSGARNHFVFEQPVLREWIVDPAHTYGGVVWIVKYLFLVMPVLFSVFIIMSIYVLAGAKAKSKAMLLLCLSPMVAAYFTHAAQYGANYFPCFAAIVAFIGYGAHVLWNKYQSSVQRKALTGVLAVILLLQLISNAFVFFNDVFPSRMASVYLSRFLSSARISRVYIHEGNLLTPYTIGRMDTASLDRLAITPIHTINQVRDGVIIVAPVSAASIYLATTPDGAEFDRDIYLNELLRKHVLDRYALASFKTMATSRIWRQEEETLSYRDLILGQFRNEDLDRTRLWVLDGRRIFEDQAINKPSAEYMDLVVNGIRNVGTKSSTYRFKGFMVHVAKSTDLAAIPLHVLNVGHPVDELRLYAYKRLPLGNALAWQPWRGRTLTPGDYNLVLYRTGPASDTDFYRVYVDEQERQRYIQNILPTAGL